MIENLDDIRSKSIQGYLASIGITPSSITSRYAWYKSPIRGENEPSFTVNRETNRWRDRGSNKKGSLIDLVMEMNSCGLVEACAILGAKPIKAHVPEKVAKVSIDIIRTFPLKSETLLGYMRGRGIPDVLSQKYCEEVYFYFPKEGEDFKVLYGIGFKNDLGAYQIRSQYFKFATAPNCFTTIPGDRSKYYMFEGFINFLSALAYYGVEQPKYETYILNGVGNLGLTLPFIQGREGLIFSDLDPAGDNVVNETGGKDMRGVYQGCNDFNDFLTRK